MLPGDRLVCAFVEAHGTREQFAHWFLHVTIVPWFRLDDPSDAIATGLKRALCDIGPFEVTVMDRVMFGPRKNRPALLVTQPTQLTVIERKVRNYLHKKRAWLVDETTKRRYEFRPHVTAQDNASPNAGDSFRCDRLYIVEQKGDYKEIISEVPLGER